jgi:hypothetical protein
MPAFEVLVQAENLEVNMFKYGKMAMICEDNRIYLPPMKIKEEIQQKAFKNEYLKAHINILFSSSWFHYQIHHWLEPFQISWQQFNMLRILRG